MATDPVRSGPTGPTWSAPVRYAEADQQGVVFNAHYLLYCDEAVGAFCAQRGILAVAERVMLVDSHLRWSGSARWGDVVAVHASCERLGTSSFDMHFVIRTDAGECCRVTTTYVLVGEDDRPTPLPDEVRAALTG
ncbi:MAG: acyl-CoA thioesterase [Jatrophihabitans sp.]|uniref:acyl-CoA thioesterase n=1 Tax=Jatrophihabitans sp. TaxID=1932789 RepID=UPI003F7DA4DD